MLASFKEEINRTIKDSKLRHRGQDLVDAVREDLLVKRDRLPDPNQVDPLLQEVRLGLKCKRYHLLRLN
jgi:hypothetical protein